MEHNPLLTKTSEKELNAEAHLQKYRRMKPQGVRRITIKENMKKVLEALSKAKRDKVGEAWMDAKELQKATNLDLFPQEFQQHH